MSDLLRRARQSYPQYDDLSDQELADRLYQRFYGDMERAEFDAKVGITPGKSGVGFFAEVPDDLKKQIEAEAFKAAEEYPDMMTGSALGRTARAGMKGLAAGPAFVSDAIGATLNLGASAMGSDTRFPTDHLGKVDQLADRLGLARPEGRIEKMADKGAEFIAGAGSGLSLGRTLAGSGNSTAAGAGRSMAEEPGSQLASAAMAGAASGSTDDPVMSTVLGLTFGALGGVRPRLGKEAQKVTNLSEKYDVPLSSGDLGSGLARFAETRMTFAPGSGRQGFLRDQNRSLLRAVDDVVPPESMEPVGESVVQSMRRAYGILRKRERNLYQSVKNQLTSKPGRDRSLDIVPLNNSKPLLRWLRKEYGESVLDPDDTAKSVVSAFNSAADDATDALNYEQFLALRSALGERGRQLDLKGAGRKAGAIKRIEAALNRDLDSWGENLARLDPGAAKTFNAAREFSKKNINPFRNDKDIYKAVSSKTRPEELADVADRIYTRITSAPNKASRAMGRMDKRGKEAVRAEMMRRIADKGRAENPGPNAPFHPSKFRNEVGRQREVSSRVLTPEQQRKMDELATVAGSTTRSPLGFNQPLTGAQLMPLGSLGLGGYVGHQLGGLPGAAIGATAPMAMAAMARPALQTQAARRFMNAQSAQRPAFNPGMLSVLLGDDEQN